MEPDLELLRRYVRDHDEAAFTELVSRHINLVYSSSCREMSGDTATAEDVTQLVFIELARNAGRLTHHPALGAWLYTSVRNVGANLRRAQQRRALREEKARLMNESSASHIPDAPVENLDPVLDDALHKLNERDRGAVVLRFLEGHSLRDVGAALGLSEDAARMRVERALEKLRTLLASRGVTSTASALTVALSQATLAAPLSPQATATAIASAAMKGAAGASSTTAFLEILTGWIKLKTTAVTAALLLVTGSTTAIILQRNRPQPPRSTTMAVMEEDMWTADTLEQLPPLLVIRPTKFEAGNGISRGARLRYRADSLKHLIAFAHGFDEHQMVISTALSEGKYDWLVTVSNPLGALRREIKQQFNVVATRGRGTRDVMLLQANGTNAPMLQPRQGFVIGGGTKRKNGLEIKGRDMKFLATTMANHFDKPVLDRTGMKGKFDMTLLWEAKPHDMAAMNIALEPLGLELVESREKIDLLFVKQAP